MDIGPDGEAIQCRYLQYDYCLIAHTIEAKPTLSLTRRKSSPVPAA